MKLITTILTILLLFIVSGKSLTSNITGTSFSYKTGAFSFLQKQGDSTGLISNETDELKSETTARENNIEPVKLKSNKNRDYKKITLIYLYKEPQKVEENSEAEDEKNKEQEDVIQSSDTVSLMQFNKPEDKSESVRTTLNQNVSENISKVSFSFQNKETSEKVSAGDLGKDENSQGNVKYQKTEVTLPEKPVKVSSDSVTIVPQEKDFNKKRFEIQLAAFSTYTLAEEFARNAENVLSYPISYREISGFYRVRLGNYSLMEAQSVMNEIVDAGYTNAYIIEIGK